MGSILHQEIGGGYASGPKIIVDVCELEPGLYEMMAMKADGEEIESVRTKHFDVAEKRYQSALRRYAEPIQKKILDSGMKVDGKYTLYSYSEFGYPMAYKFTYRGGMELCTYAQYRDAVKFLIRPAGKRGDRYHMIYKGSFAIVEGWKELPDDITWNTVAQSGLHTLKCSKYGCFDAQYFEDIKKILKHVVALHEEYKIGVNGKVYG